jgi:hypothetical protein
LVLCPHGLRFFLKVCLMLTDIFQINAVDLNLLVDVYPVRKSNVFENGDIEILDLSVEYDVGPIFDYVESSGRVTFPDNFVHRAEDDPFDKILFKELSKVNLGRCVDFGSGTRRKHCVHQICVEHVEQRLTLSKCICGARIVPHMTNFDSEDVDTVLAINSLQNNTANYQLKFLNKIKMMGWKLLICVPNVLNDIECDPGDILFQLFPTIEFTQYEMCRFYRFVPSKLIPVRKGEILVMLDGRIYDEQSLHQRRDGSYRFVACIAFKNNQVFGAALGLGKLDFVAAGHLRYGETPIVGMKREWQEMISPIPNFILLGRVDSFNQKDITFIFLAETDQLKCIPSRGKIVRIDNNTPLRYSFVMGLNMLRSYRPWEFSLDSVVQTSLRKMQKFKGGGCRRKIRKVEMDEALRKTIGDIKVFQNPHLLNVSVLKKVAIGVNIIIDDSLSFNAVDRISVSYMGICVGLARLSSKLNGKLMYTVYTVVNDFQSVASQYRMIDVNSHPSPIDTIKRLYNISDEKASRYFTANNGIIPMFLDGEGRIDYDSHGLFATFRGEERE